MNPANNCEHAMNEDSRQTLETPSPLNVIPELRARGFLYQVSHLELLEERMVQGPLTLYGGFDATAPSLQVGNLLILMLLKWFHRAGHRVIFLLGGGTTQIGDPSDKKSARPLLEKKVIRDNVDRLGAIAEGFFAGAERFKVVNNKDWLEKLGYMAFLQDIGRHFSVNRMVGFEFVRNRLDNNLPLSFLELNYMVLQATDYLHLYDQEDCVLQVGGADQWANILSGAELIRKVRGAEVSALTCPLLTTSSGAKMGKTAQGAVWLRGDMVSPYDFWQFWRNTDDRDVGRFLKLFTFLPLEEITHLEALEGAQRNLAKIRLADEVTRLVHGEGCLGGIHQTAQGFFESASSPPLPVPEKTLTPPQDLAGQGWSILDCLVASGAVASKAQARRLIRAGGVRLQGHPLTDETFHLTPESWSGEDSLHLSVGAKKHFWLAPRAPKNA